jgi:hypothetical protein
MSMGKYPILRAWDTEAPETATDAENLEWPGKSKRECTDDGTSVGDTADTI